MRSVHDPLSHLLSLTAILLIGLLASLHQVAMAGNLELQAEYVVADNATGGDCSSLGGTWDYASHTCTITTDPFDITAGTSLRIELGTTLAATGLLRNSGSISNTGTLRVEQLEIRTGGIVENAGSIFKNAEGSYSGISNDGELRSSGIISALDFIQGGGPIVNLGTIASVVQLDCTCILENRGTIANLDLAEASTVYNFGALESINAIEWLNSFDNYGTIQNSGRIAATAPMSNYGTIQNLNNIFATHPIVNYQTGTFVNSGLLEQAGSSLTNYGTFVNSGPLEHYYNAQTFNLGVITNTGTITNSSEATIDNSGLVYNLGAIVNEGRILNHTTLVIMGSGTVRNRVGASFVSESSSSVANDGAIFVNCGSLFQIQGSQTGSTPTAVGNCIPWLSRGGP